MRSIFFLFAFACSGALLAACQDDRPAFVMAVGPDGDGGAPGGHGPVGGGDGHGSPDADTARPGSDSAGLPATAFPDSAQHGKVRLVGRVLNAQGQPLANAIAQLDGLSAADTTGPDGRFEILVAAGALPAVKSASGAVDTLAIIKGARVVSELGVTRYRDSLPDIRLLRVTLTARPEPAPAEGERMLFTLRRAGSEAHRLEAARDAGSPAFSATVYLPAADTAAAFSAIADLVDREGRLRGRSDTARFQGRAGGTTLAFGSRNALPSARAVAPGSARAGDRLELRAEASDRHGGSIVSWEWDVGATGRFVSAPQGRLSVDAPARGPLVLVLRVADDEGHQAFDTARVAVTPDPFEGLAPYWGDVHTHSSFSLDFRHPTPEGRAAVCGDDPDCDPASGPAYVFRNARKQGLHFAVITDHAEDLTSREWEDTRAAVRSHEQPGAFVPFLGYEFCDSVEGLESCVNTVFPSHDGALFADRSLRRNDSMAAEYVQGHAGLWERLAAAYPQALGIVAHPPIGHSWDLPAAARGRIVGAEFSSTGGSPAAHELRPCQHSYQEGLRAGHALQAMGGGNDHEGRPGRAALTALVAKDLTRESLLEALRSRRAYATRGNRLVMKLDVEGRLMGEEFALPAEAGGGRVVTVRASVSSPKPLQSLTVFRLKKGVRTALYTARDGETSLRVAVRDHLAAGESAQYWAEVSLAGQNPAFGAEGITTPVWVEIHPPALTGSGSP